jgi:mannan endo-1,4-beta-mannosidase
MTWQASAAKLAALVFLFTVPNVVAQTAVPAAAAPVNPHASPEARGLLQYLYSISGKYTLTGQHNFPNHIARWTDRAYDFTGKYPALFGQDFGFSAGDDKDSVLARPATIAEVERQWRNGAVITFTWHEVRPTDDEPVTFRESVQGHLSDFEWNELLTPGSDLYNRWCEQVDVVAGYLKQLRDAHVPVLWRPYHEINGQWFWWNGRKGEHGSAALYRQLYDRFVNYHKLDNLIWVWNASPPGTEPNAPGPYADYFPGLQYVDVLSVDIYGEFKQSYYDDLLSLAAGKPIALGEVGALPSLDVLEKQPKWTWFMTWSELLEFATPIDTLNAVFHAPNLLTRDDPRLAGPMATIREASAPLPSHEPVTPKASKGAESLLARLYSVSGKSVLSGQDNNPRAAAASTEQIFESVGEYPAIYGQDLGVTKEAGMEVAAARQAIVDEAKRQYRNGAIISLTWSAVRPTDDEPAGFAQSVRRQLSEFEWNELLTPGTKLYQRWCAQVDAVAAFLTQLQTAGVPVLWRPYPEPNGNKFWWAGRKGIHGSAALYQQLFDRLIKHDALHNLIWVWEAAPPGFGPSGSGQYSDFFPGLGYVDAFAVNLEVPNPRWRSDSTLAHFGAGKVVGVGLTGAIPDPSFFEQEPLWSWFLVSPEDPNLTAPLRAEALCKLYADTRVLTRGGETPAARPAGGSTQLTHP